MTDTKERATAMPKGRAIINDGQNSYLRRVSDSPGVKNRDFLTGLGKREQFEESLLYNLNLLTTSNAPLSIVIIDMDGLKKINDTKGHLAGDAEIKRFTDTLGKNLRQNETASRTGGDEFIVILQNTDETGAKVFIDRINAALREQKIRSSAGSATLHGPIESSAENITYIREYLLDTADKRMYLQKEKNKFWGNMLRNTRMLGVISASTGVSGVVLEMHNKFDAADAMFTVAAAAGIVVLKYVVSPLLELKRKKNEQETKENNHNSNSNPAC